MAAPPVPDPGLVEILAELDLPRHALRAWLGDLDRFCVGHGGDRRDRAPRTLLADGGRALGSR